MSFPSPPAPKHIKTHHKRGRKDVYPEEENTFPQLQLISRPTSTSSIYPRLRTNATMATSTPPIPPTVSPPLQIPITPTLLMEPPQLEKDKVDFLKTDHLEEWLFVKKFVSRQIKNGDESGINIFLNEFPQFRVFKKKRVQQVLAHNKRQLTLLTEVETDETPVDDGKLHELLSAPFPEDYHFVKNHVYTVLDRGHQTTTASFCRHFPHFKKKFTYKSIGNAIKAAKAGYKYKKNIEEQQQQAANLLKSIFQQGAPAQQAANLLNTEDTAQQAANLLNTEAVALQGANLMKAFAKSEMSRQMLNTSQSLTKVPHMKKIAQQVLRQQLDVSSSSSTQATDATIEATIQQVPRQQLHVNKINEDHSINDDQSDSNSYEDNLDIMDFADDYVNMMEDDLTRESRKRSISSDESSNKRQKRIHYLANAAEKQCLIDIEEKKATVEEVAAARRKEEEEKKAVEEAARRAARRKEEEEKKAEEKKAEEEAARRAARHAARLEARRKEEEEKKAEEKKAEEEAARRAARHAARLEARRKEEEEKKAEEKKAEEEAARRADRHAARLEARRKEEEEKKAEEKKAEEEAARLAARHAASASAEKEKSESTVPLKEAIPIVPSATEGSAEKEKSESTVPLKEAIPIVPSATEGSEEKEKSESTVPLKEAIPIVPSATEGSAEKEKSESTVPLKEAIPIVPSATEGSEEKEKSEPSKEAIPIVPSATEGSAEKEKSEPSKEAIPMVPSATEGSAEKEKSESTKSSSVPLKEALPIVPSATVGDQSLSKRKGKGTSKTVMDMRMLKIISKSNLSSLLSDNDIVSISSDRRIVQIVCSMAESNLFSENSSTIVARMLKNIASSKRLSSYLNDDDFVSTLCDPRVVDIFDYLSKNDFRLKETKCTLNHVIVNVVNKMSGVEELNEYFEDDSLMGKINDGRFALLFWKVFAEVVENENVTHNEVNEVAVKVEDKNDTVSILGSFVLLCKRAVMG